MIRISVSYEKGDCYTCDDVTKIVYTDVIGTEMTVEGEELLNHHSPSEEHFGYIPQMVPEVFPARVSELLTFTKRNVILSP